MAIVSPPRPCQVTWLDAWHDSRSLIEVGEIGPEPPRTSVGFLVKFDAKYLYLALTYDNDGSMGGLLKIPWGCVEKTRIFSQNM